MRPQASDLNGLEVDPEMMTPEQIAEAQRLAGEWIAAQFNAIQEVSVPVGGWLSMAAQPATATFRFLRRDVSPIAPGPPLNELLHLQ